MEPRARYNDKMLSSVNNTYFNYLSIYITFERDPNKADFLLLIICVFFYIPADLCTSYMHRY